MKNKPIRTRRWGGCFYFWFHLWAQKVFIEDLQWSRPYAEWLRRNLNKEFTTDCVLTLNTNKCRRQMRKSASTEHCNELTWDTKVVYTENTKYCWNKLKTSYIKGKTTHAHELEDLFLRCQYYPKASTDSMQSWPCFMQK